VGIIVLGVLMVLDSSGVSITPLLASLGVGSVAVALALQDTLSNLFSGFYILADKPFSVGDYVKLESGIEGFIVKIGWRSTHIRQYSNNVIVVPNSTVANSTLTNFDMADKETAAYVRCGVSYSSDLKKVEEAIIRIGQEVMEREDGAVKGFTPIVRYKEFGDSSINFLVVLRAKTYDEHFKLTHEFIKALHAGFEKEGIEIPFPQRVVHMQKD
jgi:small-conductance mechanosensitive channel